MLIDVVNDVQARVNKLNRKVTSVNRNVDEKVMALGKNVFTLQLIQDPIMEKGVNALRLWTWKEKATVVYDSKKDPFTADGLFCKVQGKPNIALVATTTDGDVFGGFYSVPVTEQDSDDDFLKYLKMDRKSLMDPESGISKYLKKTYNDPDVFAFSFESHGRCDTPQRFVLKEGLLKEKAHVGFLKDDRKGFVGFGVGGAGFYLGNERSDSYCYDMSRGFEGLKDTTMTGQNNSLQTDIFCRNPPYHRCTRLVAVQLSN